MFCLTVHRSFTNNFYSRPFHALLLQQSAEPGSAGLWRCDLEGWGKCKAALGKHWGRERSGGRGKAPVAIYFKWGRFKWVWESSGKESKYFMSISSCLSTAMSLTKEATISTVFFLIREQPSELRVKQIILVWHTELSWNKLKPLPFGFTQSALHADLFWEHKK